MKKEIKEYLEKLKNKFETENNNYQVYVLDTNNSLTYIGGAETKNSIDSIITDNIEALAKRLVPKEAFIGKRVVIVSYSVSLKNFLIGPLSINTVVKNITSKGTISRKGLLVQTLYFTESEIDSGYKLKKNDFTLLVSGLLDGSIESNPFKEYTISDLR